jgi:hypothetical protein
MPTKDPFDIANRGIYSGRKKGQRPTREMLGAVQEPAREIPLFATTDVLVVGGGPSGTTAAVAAARLGAHVILAERYNHLGGLSTGGLVIWIDRMTDWEGELMIRGLAEELLDRLPKDAILGAPKEDWGSREPAAAHKWGQRHGAFHGTVTWAPLPDPEWLKMESLNMVREAGIELLLHSWVAGPLIEDGRITGAIIESKQGRVAVRAGVVVDTTGDGDIFARSGEDFEGDIDEDDIHHCANSASLVTGVDVARWLKFQDDEPDAWREILKQGREATKHFIQPLTGWRNDVVVFMGPRFSGFSVLEIDDLTEVEILSRDSIAELLSFYKGNVPGFEGAWLMLTAPQLGARHSRRLVGMDKMTGPQTKTGVICADEIGVSPSNSPNVPSVSVPYGALLPRKADNLLVAGRHISTDAQTHTFMREIPQCWLTGHAAGVAAALSANAGVSPKALDVGEVQKVLRKQGAFVREGEG